MTYLASIERTDNFLCVTVSGPANFENISGVWKDIGRECAAFGCSNVLLDGILSGRPSTLDIYRVGNRMSEFKLPSKLRVAFVSDPENIARLDFHQTVVANRATGVTIRNFVTRADAEAWLAEEQCNCQAALAREWGQDSTE